MHACMGKGWVLGHRVGGVGVGGGRGKEEGRWHCCQCRLRCRTVGLVLPREGEGEGEGEGVGSARTQTTNASIKKQPKTTKTTKQQNSKTLRQCRSAVVVELCCGYVLHVTYVGGKCRVAIEHLYQILFGGTVVQMLEGQIPVVQIHSMFTVRELPADVEIPLADRGGIGVSGTVGRSRWEVPLGSYRGAMAPAGSATGVPRSIRGAPFMGRYQQERGERFYDFLNFRFIPDSAFSCKLLLEPGGSLSLFLSWWAQGRVQLCAVCCVLCDVCCVLCAVCCELYWPSADGCRGVPTQSDPHPV